MLFDFSEISGMDQNRTISLTDAIFAFALTVLVLKLELPETVFQSNNALHSFIISLLPQLSVYFVGFIVISSFWIFHHHFLRLKKVSVPMLWLNIIFLSLVALLPFTISVIGKYPTFLEADVIFGVNVFLTVLLLLGMFLFAMKEGNLIEEVQKREVFALYTLLLFLFTTVIINLLNYYYSTNAIYLFLLFPFISIGRDIKYRLNVKNIKKE